MLYVTFKNSILMQLNCTFSINQVHVVKNVLLVITVTPLSPVGSANLVVAVTTSIYRILRHVTSALASVSSACTTLKERTAACARADTMEMLPAATAEVSLLGPQITFLYYSTIINILTL